MKGTTIKGHSKYTIEETGKILRLGKPVPVTNGVVTIDGEDMRLIDLLRQHFPKIYPAAIEPKPKQSVNQVISPVIKQPIPKKIEINTKVNVVNEINEGIKSDNVNDINVSNDVNKPSLKKTWKRNHSEHTRKLMSLAVSGSKHPNHKGNYLIKGIIYESSRIAARALNISNKTVITRCKSDKYNDYSIIPS